MSMADPWTMKYKAIFVPSKGGWISQRICELNGCLEKHFGLGRCKKHYKNEYHFRWRAKRNPNIVRRNWNHPKTCRYCERPFFAKLMCHPCYDKHYKKNKPHSCTVPDCSSTTHYHAKGMCKYHYERWRREVNETNTNV
jgi:hypothetical protein